MSKFTPGPWEVVATTMAGCYNVTTAEKETSTARNPVSAESIHKANAALIAAAPEMYNVLAEINRQIDVEISSFSNLELRVVKQLKEVLKKAGGES